MKQPFDYSFSCATVLAHMTCYQGTLPQGAPTSPFIANLICRGLDTQLMDLARRNGARYSRYCDDITFSFRAKTPALLPAAICKFDGAELDLGEELKSVIATHSFTINQDKVRISGRSRRMEVTGLTINQFPNVRRSFIDEIRGALHAWEKHGLAAAEKVWAAKPYMRQRRNGGIPPLHRVLWGKLLYLKAVRTSDDVLYNRLAERYNKLLTAAVLDVPELDGKLLPVVPVVRTDEEMKDALLVLECLADHLPSGQLVGSVGTAFAFGEHGLVTCEHVMRYEKPPVVDTDTGKPLWTDDGSDPYFHLLPGAEMVVRHPPSGEKWPIKVVALDAARDIALLTFADDKPAFLRHYSSLGSQVRSHARIRVVGFPNWQTAKKNYSSAEGQVQNTFKKYGYDRLEVSSWIRAGNSGGPVVDESRRVVGVAQQGAKQEDGSNECLCVTELESWLHDMKGKSPVLPTQTLLDLEGT